MATRSCGGRNVSFSFGLALCCFVAHELGTMKSNFKGCSNKFKHLVKALRQQLHTGEPTVGDGSAKVNILIVCVRRLKRAAAP